jgi:PTH1 family peptidyl-tRNA hydrolase
MNLSGKALNYWMQAEKIQQENIVVVTDDIALPFGMLRMKGSGGSGGHNGLKNIELVLGNANYTRLRFGVGSEFSKGNQVDYVLGSWSNEENKTLPERIAKAADMCLSFGAIGLQLTMTNFNGKYTRFINLHSLCV